MKKRNIIAITSLLGISLSCIGGVLANSKKAEQVKAAELSPYSIGDDEYEVAFLEQYMTSSSLDSYSYSSDKPLGGNNALGGHLYGNGITTPTDYVGNLNGGVNSELEWNITFGRVRGKASPNRAYLQIESSANHNLKDTTAYPQATKPDEYGIANLFSSSYSHISAMYTTTAIKNITDISIYWRSSYTKRAYICYQLDGETSWKKYADIARADNGDIKGNYSGTRGWDTFGYLTSKSSTWTGHELYGKTAKIAIACTEKSSSEEGNFPVSAILINNNKAAVRYLNKLTYHDNVCSDNGENKSFDLNKGQSDNVHNQDLFQLATENATGSFLGDYICAGSKTSEYYILGLYNHFVTSIPALGSVKASSARLFSPLGKNENSTAIMVVTILSVVSVSSITLLVVFKKKRRVL